MTINYDKEAWQKGVDAGASSRPGQPSKPSDCPYSVHDDRGLAFWSGYIEGKAQRLKAEERGQQIASKSR